MKPRNRALLLAASLITTAGLPAGAATILPADTQNLSTSYTTGDGLVTLLAYASTTPLVAGSFNTGNFIGVSDLGNANAVNDVDGDPGTPADQEALDMQFSATVGISEIRFQWSRADGPLATDGIQITGFVSDPGTSVDLVNGLGFEDVRWDNSTNSIYAELTGGQFTGDFRILQFSNLSASAGQTLRLTANDSTQGGAQAAIGSISYEVIPEPASLAMLALGCLAMIRRRR